MERCCDLRSRTVLEDIDCSGMNPLFFQRLVLALYLEIDCFRELLEGKVKEVGEQVGLFYENAGENSFGAPDSRLPKAERKKRYEKILRPWENKMLSKSGLNNLYYGICQNDLFSYRKIN